ncbi:MAG: hypothetical protein WA964_05770 [Ilumatobacter sp.]|uniref:hypothetical protein n=1 Tax=Ilumatobacter sp. TaxID=1967498 RepID=UPI003C7673B9
MSDDIRDPDADVGNDAGGDDFATWFDDHFDVEPSTEGSAEQSGVAGDTLVVEEAPASPLDVDSNHDRERHGAADVVTTSHAGRFGDRILDRVVRRPVAWWNAPWSTERIVKLIVTASSLIITTWIITRVVHFAPVPFAGDNDLILDQTTPTGGDMGAHVWAPAFLRDHFIGNGQLSGWSMDWYGGLPLYRFYMVIPAIAIIALDAVPFISYGVAFKLVAMSGLVTFPFACWAFGRLAAFRHPMPELFAFAGMVFLLDESFEIYGGNVKSTMAGEYSFSIALTLAVLGLGLLANGLRTGKYRVWAAVVISLAMVSHGIVLIFVAFAAAILCLVWIDKTRIVYAVTTGVTTLLLSLWWVGPFLFGHEFMTDMKYGFRPSGATDSFWDMYFPLTPALDIIVTTLAVIGFAAFVLRRHITGTALGLICLFFVAGVYFTRESLPVIGLLWNPRLLPFVYLLRYMLMVAGGYELVRWLIGLGREHLAARDRSLAEGATAYAVVGVSILLVFGWMYEVLPFDGKVVETEGEAAVYAWGPLRKNQTSGRAVADGWTRYNWQGYEGRPSYPAYYDLVTTMDGLGEERGCGRAIWENNKANSEYGTTMSLMLLPHWTDGCIGSMEGLFFEATASTNYHFITAAAISESSSNPVRQLRYTNNDAEVGVRHMQDLGVRYLMVRTDAAKAEAATNDELEFVAASGTWDIYEVRDSNIVEPLDVAPVVVDQSPDDDWYKPGDDRERNLELGTSWFQNRETWPAMPVDEGPDEWQRVTASIVQDQRIEPFDDQRRKVDYVAPDGGIDPTELPDIAVTDVEIRQQSLSFSVDQIGVPVLVKVSYFPNWNVSGADGPYRAGPNHMIVVPTSNDVELAYDARGGLDWFFYFMTVVGIGLCFLWRRRGDVHHVGSTPSFASATTDSNAVLPPIPTTDAGVDGANPEWSPVAADPDVVGDAMDPTPIQQASLTDDIDVRLDDDRSVWPDPSE